LTTSPSSGLSATVSPTSVSLTANGQASVTLTVSATSAGTYTVVVTGTSGSLTHSLSVLSYFPATFSGIQLSWILIGVGAPLTILGLAPGLRRRRM
jgi:hypothetical protein